MQHVGMTENGTVESQLADINRKLDYLIDRSDDMDRRIQALDDLVQDGMPIFNEIVLAFIDELEEISPYFTVEDLARLARKVAVNTRTLEEMLDRALAANEFITDAQPMLNDITLSTMEWLDGVQQKGYFEFFSTVGQTLDTIFTTTTKEDREAMVTSISQFMQGLKELAQPKK